MERKTMKALVERIKKDGIVFPGEILKVDNFLNHMVDPMLMEAMGLDFYDQFQDNGITKVLTAEVSGIAIATPTAHAFKVPMLFAKKNQSLTSNDAVYEARIYSYTKQDYFNLHVNKSFLSADDTVLIIDDFLANGEALKGLISLCEQADAQIGGIGIAIEKTFQPGGRDLREAGYSIYSQVKIKSLANETVTFE